MATQTSEILTLSASVSRKVNLGNYESADVFVSLSGLTADTTEQQIDEMLASTGALAFKKLATELNLRCSELKAKGVA
jgi:hypothetical protein